MTLPLPYVLGDEEDPIQGNFDELKKQFPLTRRHMSIEPPHVVSDVGEPAFQGAWANTGAPHEVARFWKDPMGIVHIEGMITAGVINTVAFTLPAGYRPRATLRWGTSGNSAFAVLEVQSDGDVLPLSGSATNFVINVQFKQEQ